MRLLQSVLLIIALMYLPALQARSRSAHSNSTHSHAAGSSTVSVRGYTKKNGTSLRAHRRSAPNHTQRDNWSTRGNVNPDTGKTGTKTARK